MQIRVTIQMNGKVDVVYRPNRPGERRTMVTPGVALGDVRQSLKAGVDHMRSQTKFAFKEPA